MQTKPEAKKDESKAQLPAHLIALAKKMEASGWSYTVKDVTPKGYGPTEEAE